jgi:hypothetical protein
MLDLLDLVTTKEFHLPRYKVVQFGKSQSTFRRSISPPFSESKSTPSKKPARRRQQTELVSCLACSSTLKMEAMFFRNVGFQVFQVIKMDSVMVLRTLQVLSRHKETVTFSYILLLFALLHRLFTLKGKFAPLLN